MQEEITTNFECSCVFRTSLLKCVNLNEPDACLVGFVCLFPQCPFVLEIRRSFGTVSLFLTVFYHSSSPYRHTENVANKPDFGSETFMNILFSHLLT